MAKEKQAVDTRPDQKNGHKAEPSLPQQTAVAEASPLVEAPFGLGIATDQGEPGPQAARLADPRLAAAQRQALARQIGGQQGNGHLQRMLVSLQRESGSSASGTNSSSRSMPASGSNGSQAAAGQSMSQNSTPAGDAETGLGGAVLPDMAAEGAGLPNSNGNNGHATSSSAGLIQRKDDSAEKKRPSEEEKKAALAAAQRAKAKAGQTTNHAAAETTKSRSQAAGEQQKGQAEKQKAESAKSEAEGVGKEGGGAAQPAPAATETAAGDGAAVGSEAAGEKAAPTEAAAGPGAAAGAAVAESVDIGEAPVEAVGEKAPASAQEDPAFQSVVGGVRRTGRAEKTHAPAASKADEAQAAAEMPASEVNAHAEASKVGQMEAAPTPGFDAAAFKAKLMQKIQEQAPKTAEEADDFKENDKLSGVKGEMQGQAAQEKDAAKDPMKQATQQQPDTSSVPPKPVTPLNPEQPGQPAAVTNPRAAAPKPKTSGEVEAPLKENTQRVDQQMADAGVTDQQLAKSNEPEMIGALKAKQDAHAQAETAPGEYRQFEQAQLGQAQAEAAATAQDKTQAMHGQRAAVLGQVTGHKSQTKSEDEKARAQVAADINSLYEATKTKVEKILADLDGKVSAAFDEGAAAAKQAFEDYVDARMDAYKEERYGGWLGWADWIADKLAGMPDEVNQIYVDGRNLFLQKMDAVIDNVVAIIGSGLAEAKAEIANGKKEIQKHVAALPKNLRQVGQQAAENIESKFASLEQSVDAKQDELIDTLASKYQENLQAVDSRIEELKAANRGLVDKAIDAVVGVIKIILKLKDMLENALSRIASVVTDIISAPIEFLGNLVAGIKQGFDNFVSNIMTHLQAGLIGWLTGALGGAGITLPDDIFSLEGIFSLVMQLLGLSWAYIRGKAVKLLGEPAVKALETGFELFKVLITEGPAGLWKFVKDKFSDLKEMVMDAIKDMLITEVIKAGVKWIIGLLNPASALIKAAMAIYDIITFFIDRGSEIMDLVNAVIDSVQAIVSGSIGGAAKMIENALAKALPVVIGFLANLLGIGDLAKKVQAIIHKIRDRVDQAIDGILMKAKRLAGKVLRKLGFGKKKDKESEELAKVGDPRELARVRLQGELKSEHSIEQVRGILASVQQELQPKGLHKLYLGPESKDHSYQIIAVASPPLDLMTIMPKVKEAQGTSVQTYVRLTLSDSAPAFKTEKRDVQVVPEEEDVLKYITDNFGETSDPQQFKQWKAQATQALTHTETVNVPVGSGADLSGLPEIAKARTVKGNKIPERQYRLIRKSEDAPHGRKEFGGAVFEGTGNTVEATFWSLGKLAEGDKGENSNHAEAQFINWYENKLDKGVRRRVKEIHLQVSYSPCWTCSGDLVNFLKRARQSSEQEVQGVLAWSEPYYRPSSWPPGKDRSGGSTKQSSLDDLKGAGWALTPAVLSTSKEGEEEGYVVKSSLK